MTDPTEPSGESKDLRERLDALRDEHCFITSVDVCCHCGDSECDGMACLPDSDDDEEAIENLHSSLREGQAWRVLNAVVDAGEDVLTAFMLAHEALANANNQTVTRDCEECGQQFLAQSPCDLICTACRLSHFGSSGTPGGEPCT